MVHCSGYGRSFHQVHPWNCFMETWCWRRSWHSIGFKMTRFTCRTHSPPSAGGLRDWLVQKRLVPRRQWFCSRMSGILDLTWVFLIPLSYSCLKLWKWQLSTGWQLWKIQYFPPYFHYYEFCLHPSASRWATICVAAWTSVTNVLFLSPVLMGMGIKTHKS